MLLQISRAIVRKNILPGPISNIGIPNSSSRSTQITAGPRVFFFTVGNIHSPSYNVLVVNGYNTCSHSTINFAFIECKVCENFSKKLNFLLTSILQFSNIFLYSSALQLLSRRNDCHSTFFSCLVSHALLQISQTERDFSRNLFRDRTCAWSS